MMASSLSFEQNILNTRKAVAMAAKKNASVEAEFGVMTGGEGSAHAEEGGSEDLYTDPDLAKKFVDETGIDALACSFGTVHGIYLREPKLDFDRVLNIRNKIGLPIVMHGGSGVSHDELPESDLPRCPKNQLLLLYGTCRRGCGPQPSGRIQRHCPV